jgi:hypothetical protein
LDGAHDDVSGRAVDGRAPSQQTGANVEDTITAIREGRWKRRRHGMNLEPLVMRTAVWQGDSSTDDDLTNGATGGYNSNSNSASARDDTAQQFNETLTKAKGRLKWLDAQTRFLCRMLDDLYRTGVRREIDRPRTERCHRVS